MICASRRWRPAARRCLPRLNRRLAVLLMVLILLCMSILNQFNSDEDREGMLL